MIVGLPKVIAIDDDSIWLGQVPDILEEIAEVSTAITIDEGLNKLQDQFFDIVLLDLNFKQDRRSGLDAFRIIQAMDRGVDVIVISGETNPQRLVEVFNFGISKFIPKPATTEAIRVAVKSVIKQREEKQQIVAMESGKGADGPTNPLLGNSHAIRRVRDQVASLIESGVKDILIQGETGTGKEVLARFIAHSMDQTRRFLPIHCGAISEGIAESELFGHVKGSFTGADKDRIGVFEASAGGFVFLDEIGEMPPSQQTKLLRVVQERIVQRVGSYDERKISFRLIAATHVDLEKAIREKRFREDLYYRISKNVITMPALRERREDIGILLSSFRFKKNEKLAEFTDDAIAVFQSYSWPGNVRQLFDTAERIVRSTSQNIIRPADIYAVAPEFISKSKVLKGLVGSYGSTLIVNEKKRFLIALEQAEGSRDQAAKILGLTRATFFRRMKELGVSKSGL